MLCLLLIENSLTIEINGDLNLNIYFGSAFETFENLNSNSHVQLRVF